SRCLLHACFFGNVEYDSAVYPTRFKPRKDIVNRLERLRFDRRLYLTVGSEPQRFFKIETRTDNRSSNGVPVQHYVKDGDRKLSWRKPIQHAGTTTPEHSHRLFESYGRNGGNQHSLCAADLLLNLRSGVLSFGIDRNLSSELARQRHLFRTEVHRSY